MEDVILTQQQAEECLTCWQGILRLRDWEIELNIVRSHQMTQGGLAEANWQIKKRLAVINLLDPQDFDPNWFGERDMELSIVHELLHLHLAPWSPEAETDEDVFEEQAIHAISTALVGLERRKRSG